MNAFFVEFLAPTLSQTEALSFRALLLNRVLNLDMGGIFFLMYPGVKTFCGESASIIGGFSFWARKSRLKHVTVFLLLLLLVIHRKKDQ